MPETRLAFVGREVLHRHWTLSRPAGGIEPAFFDHRAADLADLVAGFAPDAAVVFTPSELPAGLARELAPAVIAFLPDTLPVAAGHADPWRRPSAEMLAAAAQTPMLGGFDPAEYARVLAADPLVPQVAPELGIWRCPPLPVDDALYAGARRPAGRPRPLYLGPSTEHREDLLVLPKHGYDVAHYAFGLAGDALREALHAADVGIVLNRGRVTQFQPEIALHLAAGHLVVAEPMDPSRGLEPGLDHLVARTRHQVVRVLDQLAARPGAWEPVRRRGRSKAEAFRASRVWPRLLADLELELGATAAY